MSTPTALDVGSRFAPMVEKRKRWPRKKPAEGEKLPKDREPERGEAKVSSDDGSKRRKKFYG